MASRIAPLMDEGVLVEVVVNDIEQSEKVETTQSGTMIEMIHECLVKITAKKCLVNKATRAQPSCHTKFYTPN
jgi:hypothetical protein